MRWRDEEKEEESDDESALDCFIPSRLSKLIQTSKSNQSSCMDKYGNEKVNLNGDMEMDDFIQS